MKNLRQKKILEIIAEKEVETQNQLIEELNSVGVHATQATVSRDIKELRLVKELTTHGTYRYMPPSEDVENHSERLRKIFHECVTSYTCAQNIVVIKTLPGLASAACSAIDRMDIEKLAGSLAGDDTAFIAMMDVKSAGELCDLIGKYM
ncbi:MAG: arginine repressor [Oscillospiraceae bacterium]|nr:arginine repressor [Oscillospiraceae bacterium]